MSKFGWDLPAGCSMSDLPGNSPAEQEAEAFADKFFDKVEEIFGKGYHDAVENEFEKLSTWIWHEIGEAYATGYQQANADRALAEEI